MLRSIDVASYTRSGPCMLGPFRSFIHHTVSLLSVDVARGVPKSDSEAGSFKGGVHTNYLSHFKSDCENYSAEKPYDGNDKSDENHERSETCRRPRARYTSKNTNSVLE